MSMILLDLFSGIGGFSKGFEQAGYKFEKHYFSEIDKHAIANYKHNFKNAEYIGAIENISGKEIEKPDIITFGFPCQDLSNAGKRKGLDGARSSLFYEAIRIIKETKPTLFIYENVKGLLSSNSGKDFVCALQTISDIGLYECEWQLLNTKWVLPQNRERIFFIGHLAGKSLPKVFPIGENDIFFTKANNAKGTLPQTENCIANTLTKGFMRADDTFILVEPEHKHGDKLMNIADNKLRRLTEIERERLQGFPDDWTKYGNYDGTIKEIPMTARYKLLGNAVTVNIVEIIARKLKQP